MTNVQLNKEQHDVLIGSMLGDGSLQLDHKNRAKNARLIIRRSVKDTDYLLWQYSLFKDFCSDKAIRNYKDFHNKSKKYYEGISFTTKASPVFTAYYNLWYKDKKIIPSDLRLNKLIMLIWFLDDGSISRSKSGNMTIKFSTHGFSFEENIFLKFLLEQKYRETFYLNKDNGKYFIRGNSGATNAIIDDIKDIYLSCMNRKAIWNNSYKAVIHSYDIKKQKIEDYLINKDKFYLNDLGRYAGFTFTRKSRPGNVEVATSNVRKYLQEYLDKKFIIEIDDSNYHLGKLFTVTDLGRSLFLRKEVK